jgi:hypothetical protein
MAGELRAKDCYIGQRVFWVMWFDPHDTSEARTGWYDLQAMVRSCFGTTEKL